MKKIILASASPRRKDILNMMNWSFEVIPSSVEEVLIDSESPQDMVCRLALEKARDVSARFCDDETFFIGADTIVVLDGKILGKPSSKEDSLSMVKSLNGREHTVYSGIALIQGDQSISSYEKTHVKFRKLSEEDLAAYVETGEGMDKAGSYAVQGVGAVMIESIRGDYYNVVGLPLCKLASMFQKMGCSMSQMWSVK